MINPSEILLLFANLFFSSMGAPQLLQRAGFYFFLTYQPETQMGLMSKKLLAHSANLGISTDTYTFW